MESVVARAIRLPLMATVALLVTAAPAAADSYTRCPVPAGASLVAQARTTCADVEGVAQRVADAPAGEAVELLQRAGWSPYRALSAPTAAEQFDLVALRGTRVLRIRRSGPTPDLDGFASGRELVFARGTIVGGAPIPNGAAFCTSAFTVRLANGSLGGLSAAHCAGARRNGSTDRRNVAERRPPEPGLVLGRVQRYLPRTVPLDALVLPIPQQAGRSTPAVVDRGIARPPWVVAGTARLSAGRRICFTGRTSGPDRCGVLRGRSARPLERFLAIAGRLVVRCTTVRAAEGDSGGGVYTAPRADGTVRALGITTLITGRSGRMCFTPLSPVLRELDAALLVGT